MQLTVNQNGNGLVPKTTLYAASVLMKCVYMWSGESEVICTSNLMSLSACVNGFVTANRMFMSSKIRFMWKTTSQSRALPITGGRT